MAYPPQLVPVQPGREARVRCETPSIRRCWHACLPAGACCRRAGLHKPNGQTIADKMLFMVAAMAAEMERDLISERTLDGLAAAAAQGRRDGRPVAVDHDTLAIARARQARGESVTD